MTSLREMNERMDQWMAEKPTFDSGSELKLNNGDLAIFQFASSGDDGDQLIKIYRSHIVQQISKKGKAYNTHRYCPVQSGEDLPCPLCEQGIKDIKERMSIWMWVHDIMHMNLPAEKQYPMADYQGRRYYREEVNAWRVWHTSAWRDSCWPDILKLYNIYTGLHNFTAELLCTGDGLQRRYKPYALPNSPMFTAEQYAQAKAECESLPEMLRKQLNTAVEANPQQGNMQQSPSPEIVQGYQVGQAQPQGQVSTYQAPAQQPPVSTRPGENPVDPPPSQPEPDQRRPLKSLF